jgi:type I protein arginine methyltransferase
MISDRVRLHAYTEALRHTVTRGCTVLDLGTGAGIMALLAARYGARKVYAIDPNPVIQVARELAASNGFSAQIEFFESLSTAVTLPERVDVIVSDLSGTLPWLQQHLSSLTDARERFLAPGGVMIPKKHVIWAGVVESESAYQEFSQHWETGHGFDMHAARELAVNTWKSVRLRPDDLLAPPQRAAALDFAVVTDPSTKINLSFTTTRPGVGHGTLVWFDLVLTDEVFFSNAPGCHDGVNVYGQAFFPWGRPVRLEIGDVVNVGLACDFVADDYIFRWRAEVLGDGETTKIKAKFDHSDFRSLPISPAVLRKGAADYVPRTNGNASIDSFILSSMNGQDSLIAIAARLRESFPEDFHSPSQALDRVARVSRVYSE